MERTAEQAIATVAETKAALVNYKHRTRSDLRFYSQSPINNLSKHPSTKIEFVENELNVTRLIATKYLNALAKPVLCA